MKTDKIGNTGISDIADREQMIEEYKLIENEMAGFPVCGSCRHCIPRADAE
jgi:hypothetical protein